MVRQAELDGVSVRLMRMKSPPRRAGVWCVSWAFHTRALSYMYTNGVFTLTTIYRIMNGRERGVGTGDLLAFQMAALPPKVAAAERRPTLRLAFLGISTVSDANAEIARELHVPGNAIATLSPWIAPFSKLRVLDLRHNQIVDIAGIEVCARKLVALDLRDNQLGVMQAVFTCLSPMKRLERCDLRHNPFTESFSSVDHMLPAAYAMSPGSKEAHATRATWRKSMLDELPRLQLLDGVTRDKPVLPWCDQLPAITAAPDDLCSLGEASVERELVLLPMTTPCSSANQSAVPSPPLDPSASVRTPLSTQAAAPATGSRAAPPPSTSATTPPAAPASCSLASSLHVVRLPKIQMGSIALAQAAALAATELRDHLGLPGGATFPPQCSIVPQASTPVVPAFGASQGISQTPHCVPLATGDAKPPADAPMIGSHVEVHSLTTSMTLAPRPSASGAEHDGVILSELEGDSPDDRFRTMRRTFKLWRCASVNWSVSTRCLSWGGAHWRRRASRRAFRRWLAARCSTPETNRSVPDVLHRVQESSQVRVLRTRHISSCNSPSVVAASHKAKDDDSTTALSNRIEDLERFKENAIREAEAKATADRIAIDVQCAREAAERKAKANEYDVEVAKSKAKLLLSQLDLPPPQQQWQQQHLYSGQQTAALPCEPSYQVEPSQKHEHRLHTQPHHAQLHFSHTITAASASSNLARTASVADSSAHHAADASHALAQHAEPTASHIMQAARCGVGTGTDATTGTQETQTASQSTLTRAKETQVTPGRFAADFRRSTTTEPHESPSSTLESEALLEPIVETQNPLDCMPGTLAAPRASQRNPEDSMSAGAVLSLPVDEEVENYSAPQTLTTSDGTVPDVASLRGASDRGTHAEAAPSVECSPSTRTIDTVASEWRQKINEKEEELDAFRLRLEEQMEDQARCTVMINSEGTLSHEQPAETEPRGSQEQTRDVIGKMDTTRQEMIRTEQLPQQGSSVPTVKTGTVLAKSPRSHGPRLPRHIECKSTDLHSSPLAELHTVSASASTPSEDETCQPRAMKSEPLDPMLSEQCAVQSSALENAGSAQSVPSLSSACLESAQQGTMVLQQIAFNAPSTDTSAVCPEPSSLDHADDANADGIEVVASATAANNSDATAEVASVDGADDSNANHREIVVKASPADIEVAATNVVYEPCTDIACTCASAEAQSTASAQVSTNQTASNIIPSPMVRPHESSVATPSSVRDAPLADLSSSSAALTHAWAPAAPSLTSSESIPVHPAPASKVSDHSVTVDAGNKGGGHDDASPPRLIATSKAGATIVEHATFQVPRAVRPTERSEQVDPELSMSSSKDEASEQHMREQLLQFAPSPAPAVAPSSAFAPSTAPPPSLPPSAPASSEPSAPSSADARLSNSPTPLHVTTDPVPPPASRANSVPTVPPQPAQPEYTYVSGANVPTARPPPSLPPSAPMSLLSSVPPSAPLSANTSLSPSVPPSEAPPSREEAKDEFGSDDLNGDMDASNEASELLLVDEDRLVDDTELLGSPEPANDNDGDGETLELLGLPPSATLPKPSTGAFAVPELVPVEPSAPEIQLGGDESDVRQPVQVKTSRKSNVLMLGDVRAPANSDTTLDDHGTVKCTSAEDQFNAAGAQREAIQPQSQSVQVQVKTSRESHVLIIGDGKMAADADADAASTGAHHAQDVSSDTCRGIAQEFSRPQDPIPVKTSRKSNVLLLGNHADQAGTNYDDDQVGSDKEDSGDTLPLPTQPQQVAVKTSRKSHILMLGDAQDRPQKLDDDSAESEHDGDAASMEDEHRPPVHVKTTRQSHVLVLGGEHPSTVASTATPEHTPIAIPNLFETTEDGADRLPNASFSTPFTRGPARRGILTSSATRRAQDANRGSMANDAKAPAPPAARSRVKVQVDATTSPFVPMQDRTNDIATQPKRKVLRRKKKATTQQIVKVVAAQREAPTAWLPPGPTSMHASSTHASGPQAHDHVARRVTVSARVAAPSSTARRVECSVLQPPRPRDGSGGALALGASIVEIGASSDIFRMCSELLHNQDFCAVQRGVAVNVLRVLQCRNHMGDVFAFARTAMRSRGGAARSSGKASPWLAFVSGELDQLAAFVRAGMRLPGFTETGSACHQGLTITSYLAEGDAWGTHHGAKSSTLALSIWRVVLAVCSPNDDAANGPSLAPAYIIDYSVESLAAQLGI